MIKLKRTLITLAALLGTAATSFGGLLGENYAFTGLGYTHISATGGFDGWGGVAGLNYNIVSQDNYGIDVTGGYGYNRLSERGFRDSSHVFNVGAIAFTDLGNVRVFGGVDTGWLWGEWRVRGWGSDSNDSWLIGFEAGAEFAISDAFSLTHSIRLDRIDDDRSWEWSLNLGAHYWINDSIGAGLNYSVSDGPLRSHTCMALVTFRY